MLLRGAARILRPFVALIVVGLLLAGASPAVAAEPAGYEYFHTYAENGRSSTTSWRRIRTSRRSSRSARATKGRQIWAVKLTQNVAGPTDGKPEVMINALMHASERASNELALYMLQVLANNYGLAGSLGAQGHRDPQHDRRLRHPDDEPGRRRVRLLRRTFPQVAQEPPANARPTLRRHRPQSAVRLYMELLPRRREPKAVERLLPGASAPSTRRRTAPTATSSTAGSSTASRRSRRSSACTRPRARSSGRTRTRRPTCQRT